MNTSINTFNKNIFRVECDSMKPTLNKGDLAVYEPIKLNYREEDGVKKVRRIQFLIKGGIYIIEDVNKSFFF